jgi:hypothetical protein
VKRLLSEMRDLCKDKPAAVLGGGPSLPGDLARVPAGAVLIAVNYHALRLVEADYMVYNDPPEADPRMIEAVASTKAVKVSQDPSSDVGFDVEAWTGFYSSNTATWLALWMGCDPVILCGMDCYQGEQVYFHEHDRDQPSFHYPLDMHLRPWLEEGRHLLPNRERVRVMSGPLGRVFPLYEGAR